MAGWVLVWSAFAATGDPAHFETDYGPMFLEQEGERITGFYPDYKGIVQGALDTRGEWLNGLWMQPDSERRCERPVHGAWYWGTLAFRGITTDRFEGFWAFCDDPPGSGGQWNGKRVGGDRLLEPDAAPRGNELKVKWRAPCPWTTGPAARPDLCGAWAGHPAGVRVVTPMPCAGIAGPRCRSGHVSFSTGRLPSTPARG